MMAMQAGEMPPQAKECLSHQRLGEAGSILPETLWKEHSPADTLNSGSSSLER